MVKFFITIKDNPIINNMEIKLEEAQIKPSYILENRKPGDYYTILMVDPDAPYPDDPKYKYFLHWMIINNNKTAKRFTPPNPPKGPAHHYNIILLKQKKYIDNMPTFERKNFDLSAFMKKYQLKVVKKIVFITSA